ncbi:MAG: amino acid ABC transporter permease [Eubacteriaceae bacterium]|jgi:His/Glu/Gln/Arg/opine family amino acid ABC transporter permease subunit|nr:amino acid ABC transporter permease [Eubacteriaceae bacterium]
MIYLKGIGVAYTGLLMTLEITAVAVIIGVGLGLLVALGKLSKHRILKVIASVYVEIIRGTPLLVQALILYGGLPGLLQANGIFFTWRGIEPLCGMLACGLNSAAYVAEIIRAGLQAVDSGQIEAARSLGMTNAMTKRYIVIPQAFRIILPALGNEFITLIKETAVLSVIAIVEVTRVGMLWASQTFEAWPAYLGVAIVYLSLTIPLSRLVLYMERRMAVSDRSN